MVRRRQRLKVVLDTNVLVRSVHSSRRDSFNRRIVRQWLAEKRLQLLVSDELVSEYLEVFERVLDFNADQLDFWRQRFTTDERVTMIQLGPRCIGSRDSDDDLLLSVASVGKADVLVTNDCDLLELPQQIRQRLSFAIVSPRDFLRQISPD